MARKLDAVTWLNRLFQGLGRQSLKIELLAIIKDMAYEDPNDPDVQQSMMDICQSLSTVLNAEGRSYTVDQCIEELKQVLQVERAEIAARIAGERIREFARRKRSSTKSGFSIL